jgi:uncharacterized damage-inducible protein DinB
MPVQLGLDDLMDYTDWERLKWQDWFRQQGEPALQVSAGPHGDGRFENIGSMVKHIFSAEKRYVDRLSGRSLTDPSSISTSDVEALFEFGRQSRKDIRELVAGFPDGEWAVPQEFQMGPYSIKATPKKIVVHVLMHEIRHWAQIATLLRMSGRKGEFHDFLFCPVFGSEPGREEAKA